MLSWLYDFLDITAHVKTACMRIGGSHGFMDLKPCLNM